MNATTYDPIPPRSRLLIAAPALLTAAALLCGVLALAGHYDGEFLQVARAQTTTTPAHPQAPVA